MFDRLHTFNQDPHSTISQQINYVEEHSPSFVRIGVVQEGAIYFHYVEIYQAEPGQPREACTKIVEPDLDAQLS